MPVGAIFGYLGQRQVNKTNVKLAREARDHDVNMWNMQNQYNTPEMQMQRMREAGLNPNLMYGQGNTGNAAPVPKSPVPEVGNELTGLAQMSAIPALSLYQDFKVKNAQIDNLEAQADATRQNAALTALRRITQGYTNTKMKIQQPWINLQEQNKTLLGAHKAEQANLQTNFLETVLPQQLQSVILRNNFLNQQIRGQKLENDLNEDLKPYGGSSRDNLLYRSIMKLVFPHIQSKLPNTLTNSNK